jgi:hypothetical protein
MPCHHALAEALRAYIDAAGIAEDRKGFLFRTARGHNGSILSDKAMKGRHLKINYSPISTPPLPDRRSTDRSRDALIAPGNNSSGSGVMLIASPSPRSNTPHHDVHGAPAAIEFSCRGTPRTEDRD